MKNAVNRELRLRNAILDRYVSLRQFAEAAEVPYSTVMTVLARGIGGASFDTVMKMCKMLDIDPREL